MMKLFFTVVCAYLLLMLIPHHAVLSMSLKPMIVGTLIVWVWNRPRPKSSGQWLLVAALACSLLGDIFLMLPGDSSKLFITGLTSFLIAHLFYILLFSRGFKIMRSNKAMLIGSFGLLVGYGYIMLMILQGSLGPLLLPVIGYMLIILSMAWLAINRKNQVSAQSYNWVTIGAILFVISDSILAINKFYVPLPASGFFIMSTYSFAQYGLVKGIVYEWNLPSEKG